MGSLEPGLQLHEFVCFFVSLQPEPTYQGTQSEPLQDQRGEDRREGEEEDQVATGERLAGVRDKGTARAAARETAPRIPLQTITRLSCQGAPRYLLRKR